MRFIKKPFLSSFGAFIVGGLAIGLLIFYTPLRYTPFIEPVTKNITNTDFYSLYKQAPDSYIFIDVRDAETYADGHPAGAINIPLAKLYTERVNLPFSEKKIVLICAGNSASGVGFSYLQHYGFNNIERIPGGYREWLIAGLPISTSTSTLKQ